MGIRPILIMRSLHGIAQSDITFQSRRHLESYADRRSKVETSLISARMMVVPHKAITRTHIGVWAHTFLPELITRIYEYWESISLDITLDTDSQTDTTADKQTVGDKIHTMYRLQQPLRYGMVADTKRIAGLDIPLIGRSLRITVTPTQNNTQNK